MTVHVVGGGLAGLAAAVAAAARGLPVALYESGPRLGGRCTTYADPILGLAVDNGTHVIVPANVATLHYLTLIGAAGSLTPDRSGTILMHDLRTRTDFSARSRLGWRDVVAMARLALSWPGAVAGPAFNNSRAVPGFWQPLTTAALNTPLREADARLLWRTARRMFAGGREPVPLMAASSLAATFVDPAARWLAAHGVAINLREAVTSWDAEFGSMTALRTAHRTIAVSRTDRVVIALPFWSPLVPRLGVDVAPFRASPIVNVVYRLDGPAAETPSMTGLVGGLGQWVLRRGHLATVTISAADSLVSRPAAEIGREIWIEIAGLMGRRPDPLPAFRVIKERRATLRHTPATQRARPGSRSPLSNVRLAGDWVRPDLPCTIESAIGSGFAAAAGS
jgi:glycine/D-amino acid oxidase-like deaminating enzyme